MNKAPSQTTIEYDNGSGLNPSLMTAGLPSGSILKAYHHQHLNQNRATDTEPIVMSNSLENKTSQYTIVSHRTLSDTYLNLSRKDINNVMTALHTLAQYVQTDDRASHPLPMLYSKSTNHTLKSSTQENSSSDQYYYHHPRHTLRNRRYSSSSDRYHHIKHHLDLVEEFHHDLYDMKRKQEQRRILRQLQHHQKYLNHQHPSDYPSYSSNALLYASTCEPNARPGQIYHCSQARQSAVKIPSEDQYQRSIKKQLSSSIALSTYILDKLVYIGQQQQPISTIQMLPQQAQTLEIMQNNHLHSLMSVDSLNTSFLPGHLAKINRDQATGMGDQLSSKKIDVATQWSSQMLPPKYIEMNASKSDFSSKYEDEQEVSGLQTTSATLTELSQSITTDVIKHSVANVTSLSKTQSFINNSSSLTINDERELTPSETERFLKTLNISTCKCITTKQRSLEIGGPISTLNDKEVCISMDHVACPASSEQKKTKQTSIKFSTKRPRYHRSKTNRRIKRPRRHPCSTPVKQSHEIPDTTEDSSFDFFDLDTTFTDTYDRLFTDTTTTSDTSST